MPKCTIEFCHEIAVAQGLCYECLNNALYVENGDDFPTELLAALDGGWWGYEVQEVCQ